MKGCSKITIRPIKPNRPMTWMNCEVLLNKKKLEGLVALDFSVRAGDICVVRLEVLSEIDLHANLNNKQIRKYRA